ncbi:MAG: Glu-tRNA(Gln) amidotransferase subunit GatD [Candidatus Altiarchaeota archaeon]|nr:Glu-tRNA(Gln) amidotransferase subunit GatD [Candidatus Altiarchaeota archaeon]
MAKTNRVKITTKDGRIFIGYEIPKSDSSSDDISIIKLDNGYNIGVNTNKILKKEILKGMAQIKKIPVPKITGHGPKISLVGTGGTIASRVDYITGGVEGSMSTDEIISNVPEAADYADLKFVDVMNKQSEDFSPKDWLKIASAVYKELKKSEGVIVTHGTDTMHYTSSIMSFLIDTTKPIVFTGAQRSSDRPSSDAFMNILCSIHAAKQRIPESMICFHSSMSDDFNFLMRGNRTKKLHTSARHAFKSVNQLPLAKVWVDGKFKKLSDPIKEQKPKLFSKLEEKVALVKVFPGSDPAILDYYASKNYKGIVLEGTGLGHVPVNSKKSWIPKLEELKDEMTFVVTSQTDHGRTHKHVYSNLRKVSRLGVLYVEDMIPETAYTKLMWVLGNKLETSIMNQNVKGELSNRTTLI